MFTFLPPKKVVSLLSLKSVGWWLITPATTSILTRDFLARKIKRFNSHSCFNMGGSSCLDFSHHLTWWTILLIFDATMRWVVLPIPWHWSQRFWGVNFSKKIAIQNIGTVLYYFVLTGFFKQGQNLSIFSQNIKLEGDVCFLRCSPFPWTVGWFSSK